MKLARKQTLNVTTQSFRCGGSLDAPAFFDTTYRVCVGATCVGVWVDFSPALQSPRAPQYPGLLNGLRLAS
jgi:hypothetical protein